MLKCKINREKKCKIIQKSTIYNMKQTFANFKISLGGGVHFSNAQIYSINSINVRRYNNMSTRVL